MNDHRSLPIITYLEIFQRDGHLPKIISHEQSHIVIYLHIYRIISNE